MVEVNTIQNGMMPGQRLREKGVETLGDAELLALLIGSGKGTGPLEVARRLLDNIGGISGLPVQGVGLLSKQSGVGSAKAARLVAAVELGVRLSESRGRRNGRLSSSADIFDRYRARMSQRLQEVFLVVGMNSKNEVIKEELVAKGSVNECMINPREVFRPLIIEACSRMVVLHNHPSGDSRPSAADITVTKRLEEVGKLIGIPMLDHVVIGKGCYTSMRDMGLLEG
jgi:DNA repair protein RadC